jgi:hypothetical protein
MLKGTIEEFVLENGQPGCKAARLWRSAWPSRR